MKTLSSICFALTAAALVSACAPDSAIPSKEDARSDDSALANLGPCPAGLDYAGQCNGSELAWCEDGSELTVDCADSGRACGFQDDSVGYNCIATTTPPGGACGDVDYEGYCEGDQLVWCENDALQELDCAGSGRTCGYQGSGVGYNCLAGSSGSGDHLTIGEIVGGVSYSVSQAYGPSDFFGGYDYCQSYGDWGGQNVHCGLDVAIPYGTALYVPGNGTVLIAGETQYFEDETNPSAGELRIGFADGTEVILGHMSQIVLGDGQSVSAGQYAGVSGTANGDHVHVEVRVPSGAYASGFATVDPLGYFGG